MMDDAIKVMIIDDEPLARKFIRRMLKDDDGVEIVGEIGGGREAVTAITQMKPDLVFLDVQMPEMDGFTVLEMLGTDQIPRVIFVTAYDKYAIQAFEVHAVDYLLKPFDHKRLDASLRRAKTELRGRQNTDEFLQISALIEDLRAKPEYLDRLMVKVEGRIMLLKTEEIEWIEADDKYLHLHAEGRSHLVRMTLNVLESRLNPRKFLRIHRSAIVNIDRIKELQPLFNGEHRIILESGVAITLSRNYRSRFYDKLGKPF